VNARVLLLALVVATAGCAADPREGYSTQSTFREDVATVAIPIFDNDSFSRDVEFELTDALVKEIEARTPYKVASPARADTIIIGTIRRVELDRLSKSRQTGLAEEMIISLTVDFQWKDLRTDRTLLERRSFDGHALFVPSNPSGESLEIGRHGVVQTLARDIVSEMRAAW
jgi:hypothetical protein